MAQIDIFTITSANKTAIYQINYKDRRWMDLVSTFIACRHRSAITACQNIGPNITAHSLICLFYETEHGTINMTPFSVDNSVASRAMATDIDLPIGIPMSIDGSLQVKNNITKSLQSNTKQIYSKLTKTRDDRGEDPGRPLAGSINVIISEQNFQILVNPPMSFNGELPMRTRPKSVRRRQSMLGLEPENRVEELMHDAKDDGLWSTIQSLQTEVNRLTHINALLCTENAALKIQQHEVYNRVETSGTPTWNELPETHVGNLDLDLPYFV
jgi:hypothetical protein